MDLKFVCVLIRVAEGVPLYDILNDFQKGHSHMAVVVKCNKEKAESVKQNSEQSKADERQPPKNFESKSTKSIGSDLTLPLSYLWTEMSLALHFLNCCL